VRGQSYVELPVKGLFRDYLATYPPDPLPLLREGGVYGGEELRPSLKPLPPHARNTSPSLGEGFSLKGIKRGEVNKQPHFYPDFISTFIINMLI